MDTNTLVDDIPVYHRTINRLFFRIKEDKMRGRKDILKDVYAERLSPTAHESIKGSAILEVLLDIRELLGQELPKMLADLKFSLIEEIQYQGKGKR